MQTKFEDWAHHDFRSLIYTEKESAGGLALFYSNGIRLGELEPLDDGFYNFWPSSDRQGCWSAQVLQAIAWKLWELNLPWQNQIERDFNDSDNPIS